MYLSNEIKELLEKNGITNIDSLQNSTRNDLKNCKLNNNQISQIIIYLQLKGLDLKKNIKKKQSEIF